VIDALADRYTVLRELGRGEWHRYGFAAFRGRFYFTPGDRQSDLWTTSVAADR
jgi:hypothetical protein